MALYAREPAASSSAGSRVQLPDFSYDHQHRDLNILFASVGCSDPKIVHDLLPQIADIPDVSLRAVLDPSFRGQDFILATSYCLSQSNVARHSPIRDAEDVEKEAAELCEWANLLVLAPIDANNFAKMLHGHTDNLLLEILRSWNVSKKILMVPGMSALMWENPMTKKQLVSIDLVLHTCLRHMLTLLPTTFRPRSVANGTGFMCCSLYCGISWRTKRRWSPGRLRKSWWMLSETKLI